MFTSFTLLVIYDVALKSLFTNFTRRCSRVRFGRLTWTVQKAAFSMDCRKWPRSWWTRLCSGKFAVARRRFSFVFVFATIVTEIQKHWICQRLLHQYTSSNSITTLTNVVSCLRFGTKSLCLHEFTNPIQLPTDRYQLHRADWMCSPRQQNTVNENQKLELSRHN